MTIEEFTLYVERNKANYVFRGITLKATSDGKLWSQLGYDVNRLLWWHSLLRLNAKGKEEEVHRFFFTSAREALIDTSVFPIGSKLNFVC